MPLYPFPVGQLLSLSDSLLNTSERSWSLEHKSQGSVIMTEVCAVVIRADGTREDLGTVAYWHRNPLKRWWVRRFKMWKGER